MTELEKALSSSSLLYMTGKTVRLQFETHADALVAY